MTEDLKNTEAILKHHQFIMPSFSIYGSSAGIFDFGPLGCKLKKNFINLWYDYFVIHDDLEELDTSILLSYDVLKASGHVDRFCDLMTFDSVNGEFYRADHLITQRLKENIKNELTDEQKKELSEIINDKSKNDLISTLIEEIETYSAEKLTKIIKTLKLKSEKQNELTEVQKFNLIFQTNIGPLKSNISFLRPETAQGQFTSFFRMSNKLPFGTASIGKVFRNEISPRNFLRLREFEQCEIEYFTDPLEKTNPNFIVDSEIELPLFLDEKIFLKKGKELLNLCSQVLSYFIIRSYSFLLSIGMKKEFIRIRRHKKEEMSHYAVDCWDIECKTSYGWVECIGIADRGVYDLTQHSERSKVKLNFTRECDKEVFIYEEKEFSYEEMVSYLQKENIKILSHSKNEIQIEKGRVIKLKSKNVKKEYFVPNVIEPSFGLNRILYALSEHSFYLREDRRNVFSFCEKMAPIFLEMSFMQNNQLLVDFFRSITVKMPHKKNFRSVSIGKKYSVADEIGVKFYLTVDYQSLEDNCVTIRERDTMNQIRVSVSELDLLIRRLWDGEWDLVFAEKGKFN